MKRMRNYIILAATVLLMLAACTANEEEVTTQGTPVEVNLSRAEGIDPQAEEGDLSERYALVFWTDDNDGTGTAWMVTISGTNVDSYNYEDRRYFNVPDDKGTPAVYPSNNEPLYANGYYPADAFDADEEYDVLTLKQEVYEPGFVDVCTTKKVVGSENAKFKDDSNKELRYEHTQVRLNFKVQATEDVKGQLADVIVEVPMYEMPVQWIYSYQDEQYIAQPNQDEHRFLKMYSENEWIIPGQPAVSLYGGEKKENEVVTIWKDKEYCYIRPTNRIFFDYQEENKPTEMKVRLEAKIFDSTGETPDRKVSGDVMVPLKLIERDQQGNISKEEYLTRDVQAGDAFTITIIFKQNKLELLAEKGKWDSGPYIIIPLNPNS